MGELTKIKQIEGLQDVLDGSPTKIDKAYTDWNFALNTKDILLAALASKTKIVSLVVNVTTAFLGTGISASQIKLNIGIVGDTAKYTFISKDVGSVTFHDLAPNTIESISGSTNVQIELVSTGATLDNLTQGAIEFHIETKKRLQ